MAYTPQKGRSILRNKMRIPAIVRCALSKVQKIGEADIQEMADISWISTKQTEKSEWFRVTIHAQNTRFMCVVQKIFGTYNFYVVRTIVKSITFDCGTYKEEDETSIYQDWDTEFHMLGK